MKKLLTSFSVAAAVVLSLSACNKIKDKVFQAFTAEGAKVQLSIDEASTTEESKLAEVQVNFNVDSTIKAHTSRFGIEDIKSIKAEEVSFMLTEGDAENNLNNFESLKVKYSAGSNSPVEIASITLPDSGTPRMEVALTPDQSKQLIDYFRYSPQGRYEVYGRARRTTNRQLPGVLTVKFKLDR